MASDHSRQLSELTLLETMYPEEFRWKSQRPDDLDTDEQSIDEETGNGVLEFGFVANSSYNLEFTLPSGYPSTSRPAVYLTCGDTVDTRARKETRSVLATLVNEICEDGAGNEVLDIIIQRFVDEIATPNTHDSSITMAAQEASTQRDQAVIYKRVVIWSHHLLSTAKRKDIISWSAELRLAGFSRPGYPGGIFVEGEEGDVDEFVSRLKGLKWQALQIRGVEVGKERVLGEGRGVTEVGGLGEVVDGLKDEGCRNMFLDGMRIGVGGSNIHGI
ncbi:hypothetical protein H072_11134 [Dactylellina haptotyla CBS 200.50]|uniref:RWD domain-containing protein n=1 Tax=Dactylellina haptotyla (strain CBS 200.50) TaxID=1284197 RepID=S7ZXH7_DACHA|nr:hypothetical protein H072_11134 [Dactylellina haptotyla CBS 200.50]